MGSRTTWIVLAALLVGGAVALFWVQNSARVTQLSFDVGFAAWQLQEPVPVPVLMATCAVVGLLAAALPMWLRQSRLSRRIADLEQRLAVAELEQTAGRKTDKEPGTW